MNNVVNYAFPISILLLVCWGAHAWFTWEWGITTSQTFAIQFVFNIIAYLYKRYNKIKLVYDNNINIAAICLLCATMWQNFGITPFIVFLLKYYPLLVIYSDKDNIERNISYVVRPLAIISILGLILHIFMLFTGILPSVIIQMPKMELYSFFNYYVLIKGAVSYEADGERFQSIFLEPGYLGTLFAFLLYTVDYNLKKWENIIMLVALGFSLSLAGYLTAIIGFIVNRNSKGLNIKRFFSLLLLVIGIYYGAQIYNNGKNLVNEKIVQRLQYDNEKAIKGNNRVGETTDFYFDKFLKSGEIITGIGDREVARINRGGIDDGKFEEQIRGAGYKVFLINKGIVGALFFLLFYYFMAKQLRGNVRYSMGYLLLIVISFVQAAYPESYSWLIPFILMLVIQERQCNISSNNENIVCNSH